MEQRLISNDQLSGRFTEPDFCWWSPLLSKKLQRNWRPIRN